MFVRRSTYNDMEARAKVAVTMEKLWMKKYEAMVAQWNELVTKLNANGGIGSKTTSDKFSADDVKRLLMLCHPDKHDGKQMASDMTVKLIALKQKLEKS